MTRTSSYNSYRIRFLIISTIIVLGNIPMLILSAFTYIDPFMYNDVGYTLISIKYGHFLDPEVNYIIMLYSLYTIFIIITAIPMNLFLSSPFMGLLLLIIVYIVLTRFRKMINNKIMSMHLMILICSIILLESYGFLSAYYNFWRHAIGTYLFLSLLLILLRLIDNVTNVKTFGYSIMLFILSTVLIRYDYTASTWLLTVTFCLLLILNLLPRYARPPTSKIINFALFFIVSYWTFHEVIYRYFESILDRLKSTDFIYNVLRDFIFGRYLGINKESEFAFVYERPFIFKLTSTVYSLILLTSIVYVSIYSLVMLLRAGLKNSGRPMKNNTKRIAIHALTLSLTTVIVLDIIGYLMEGYFSLRPLMLFGPFYVFILFLIPNGIDGGLKHAKRYWRRYISWLLITIGLVSLLISWYGHIFIVKDFVYSTSMYNDVDECAHFIGSFMELSLYSCKYPSYTVGPIGDHHTMGRIYMIVALMGKCFDFRIIDEDVLHALMHGSNFKEKYTVIINTGIKIFYALHWSLYRQLNVTEYSLIYKNSKVDKIYDGKVLILQVN